MENTKPTSNKAENGNKSKPLLSLRLIKDFFAPKKQIKITKGLNVAKLEDLTWRFPYLKFNQKDYFLADCKQGKYQEVNKKVIILNNNY